MSKLPVTVEERAKAISACNFVKDSITKSLKDAPYDACVHQVADCLTDQLNLFKKLGFISDFSIKVEDGCYTFRMVNTLGELI